MTSFTQGCTKLMEGKDKTENKKDIVELLRKLADMLEEQEYTNIRPPYTWGDDIAYPTNTKIKPVITRPTDWDLQNPIVPYTDYPTKLGPVITRPGNWDDITNPTKLGPIITRPGNWDDMTNPNPVITIPDYPDGNGGILPRGPRFQPQQLQVQPQAYVIADKVDCALWDDGSCGRKAAKGDKINHRYGFIHPIHFQKKCHTSVYFC